MITAEAQEFLAELINQLFHADELITEQAERIEAFAAEIDQVRTTPADNAGAAAGAAALGTSLLTQTLHRLG